MRPDLDLVTPEAAPLFVLVPDGIKMRDRIHPSQRELDIVLKLGNWPYQDGLLTTCGQLAILLVASLRTHTAIGY